MASLLPRTLHADHPLLAEVARQACRTTRAAAVAITRAPRVAGPDHTLIACSGDAELLADLEALSPGDFPHGEPIVTHRDGAVALLPIGDEAFGTLVVLRPALPRGQALRDALEGLVPLAAEALRAAEAERDLARTLDASVRSLSALLDLRDGYTGRHSSTVVCLCEDVGRRVGMTGAELEHLRVAAHLHDLGKIGVPDEILHKPGSLDATEWSIMREHPAWGARALEQIPGFSPAARAVRHHHERWDGTGYPDRLVSEEIPLAARVIAVCDAYEAMTSSRPYRPALPPSVARERIVEGAGTQFDPAAAWALLATLPTEP